jgi:hypothetical protein
VVVNVERKKNGREGRGERGGGGDRTQCKDTVTPKTMRCSVSHAPPIPCVALTHYQNTLSTDNGGDDTSKKKSHSISTSKGEQREHPGKGIRCLCAL